MRIFLVSGLLLLGACATESGGAQQAAAPEKTTCGDPAWLQSLVGRPGADIDAEATAKGIRHRILKIGQMATMDFWPDRLTVQLDAQGKAASARCG